MTKNSVTSGRSVKEAARIGTGKPRTKVTRRAPGPSAVTSEASAGGAKSTERKSAGPRILVGLDLGDRTSHAFQLDVVTGEAFDGKVDMTKEALTARFGGLTDTRVVIESGRTRGGCRRTSRGSDTRCSWRTRAS